MGSYLTLREIQLEELKIAKTITEFCERNQIAYFLSSGSLLGAVRHEGFIPWDDDMDLYMLRDDYTKFCETFADNTLQLRYCENGTLYAPFAKVCNPKIKVERDVVNGSDNSMLWVDIFPLDGIPKPGLRQKVYFARIRYMERMIYMSRATKTHGSFIKKLIWRIFHSYFYNKDEEFSGELARKISSYRRGFSASKTGYVCSPGYAYPYEIFKHRKKYKFEDTEFFSVEDFDSYLSTVYGEYMKMPPVEKRGGHSMKAYYVT